MLELIGGFGLLRLVHAFDPHNRTALCFYYYIFFFSDMLIRKFDHIIIESAIPPRSLINSHFRFW